MVNDVLANCSGSCSFQFSQELTPLVSDVEYSSGNGVLCLNKVAKTLFSEKDLPDADYSVCVFFWKFLIFMETALASGALLISFSLKICSTDMFLRSQEDGRGIKGR